MNLSFKAQRLRAAAWANSQSNRRTQALPAGFAAFPFTGAFVIAGTDTDPGGEPFGAAEHGPVGADFHQQHGRADAVDARQGLEQHQ